MLNKPAPVPAVIESVAEFLCRVAGVEIGRCPHCAHGRMQVIGALPPVRPSHQRPTATGPPA